MEQSGGRSRFLCWELVGLICFAGGDTSKQGKSREIKGNQGKTREIKGNRGNQGKSGENKGNRGIQGEIRNPGETRVSLW